MLEEAAKASSLLIELEAKPPDDFYGLYRRAQEDKLRIEKALRSSGYYDGDVTIRIAGKSVDEPAATDVEPDAKTKVPVTIELHPGELYHLREVRVTGAEALPSKLQPELAPKAPARAADIVAEQDRLLNAVLAQGYPFATVKLEPAQVDHKDRTLAVHYIVEPDRRPPSANFASRASTASMPISSTAASPSSRTSRMRQARSPSCAMTSAPSACSNR
jgi:translocation and assembly module TamA